MTPPALTAKPAYHLDQRETVTELGCKVRTGFTALAYDRENRRFEGIVEHVTVAVETSSDSGRYANA